MRSEYLRTLQEKEDKRKGGLFIARLYPDGAWLLIQYMHMRHLADSPDGCVSAVALRAAVPCADTALLPPGRAFRVVGTATVTLQDDAPQGFGEQLLPASEPLPAGTAQLANMAVEQRLRRMGVARLLLAAAEQHALAAGVPAMSLKVHAKNAAARQLYASCGFREASVQKRLTLQSIMRLGRQAELLVMVKQLSGDGALERCTGVQHVA